MCNIIPPNKDWIDILSALTMPTIAVVGSIIAYQQWKINEMRYRHELYDKRMKVYTKLISYLMAMQHEPSFPNDTYSQWINASYEGFFLFDDKMNAYLEGINDKSRTYRSNQRKLDTKKEKSSKEEYEKLCATDEELYIWLGEQVDVAKNMFSRFLKLST